MIEKYKDILYLEHPTSRYHSRMPMIKRAAQFAPFSALAGYEEAQQEAIRRNESRFEHEKGIPFSY